MNRPWYQQIASILTGTLQTTLRRFPVTVLFGIALSVYLIHLIATDYETENKLIVIIGYYLSAGTLLSLTLHLWSEEMENPVRKAIAHVLPHGLLIADALFLYSLSPGESLTEIGIAHGAAIFAIGISVFFLSFSRTKNDMPNWNFASASFGAFITSILIGSVMSLGTCLLAYSLQALFNIEVNHKAYGYIVTVCNVFLSLLLFLGMLPQGREKHNESPHASPFLNGIIRYLFLPLEMGYILVLYIYAAKILITWELPTGWVSWLVTLMMAGCIAIEFGIYPSRIGRERQTDKRIAYRLPLVALPLLVLMTVSIMRRFQDYGISINRLYLITFNAWCYIVCIGLILNKARRINWIPVSFSVIFLLTSVLPVNYAGITRNKIHADIESELKASGISSLPLSREGYEKWLASLPYAHAANINDRVRYMRNWFGWESISDLVDQDISLYSLPEAESPHFSYQGETEPSEPLPIPEGHNQVIEIDQYMSGADGSLPDKWWENGSLPVPLELTGDTVYFDLDTIWKLQVHTSGGTFPETASMPPTALRCNSPDKSFVLTRFSLNYNKTNIEDTHLSFKGYLFYQK